MAKRRSWGAEQIELAKKLKPESFADLVKNFANRRIRVPGSAEKILRILRVQGRLEDGETYRSIRDDESLSIGAIARAGKRAT